MNAASQHLLGLAQLHQKPLAKALREHTGGDEKAIFSEELAALLAVVPALPAGQDTPGAEQTAAPLGGQKGEIGPVAPAPGRPVSAIVPALSGKETPPAGNSDGNFLPLPVDNDISTQRLGSGENLQVVNETRQSVAERIGSGLTTQTPIKPTVATNPLGETTEAATVATAARIDAFGVSAQRGVDSRQTAAIPMGAEPHTTPPNPQQIASQKSANIAQATENSHPRVNEGAGRNPIGQESNPLVTPQGPAQISARQPAEQILGIRNALLSETVIPQSFESAQPANNPHQQTLSAEAAPIKPDGRVLAITNKPDKTMAPNPLPLAESFAPTTTVQTRIAASENGANAQALGLGRPMNAAGHAQALGESLERVDEPFSPVVTKIALSPKSDLPAPSQVTSVKPVSADVLASSLEGMGDSSTDDGAGTTSSHSQSGPSLGNPVATARNPAAANFASMQFNDPQFQRNFNDHILLMAGQGIQKAHLSLNPQDLGPVEIRLAMQNDEVSIQLASTNAVVREALEQALPRLREMFEQTGLKLVDQQVAGQFSDQGTGRSFMQENSRGQQTFTEFGDARELAAGDIPPRRTASGLVDTYI